MSVLTVVGFAQEVINTNTHRLEQVADGVYFATGTGDIYTMSNALIIERDEDIVIVDSHITPAAGRALLDSIRIVSDKPVTTMINSHFHYDHSNGTPAFGEDLEIIGTLQLSFIQYLTYRGGIRAQIEAVRIRKDKRGLGIGKVMFEWAINRAKARKAHLLQLTTDKKRPKAIKFYEELGFKQSHEGMKMHFN